MGEQTLFETGSSCSRAGWLSVGYFYLCLPGCFHVSSQRFSPFHVKLIPRYSILSVAVVNGVFITTLPSAWLFVYVKTPPFSVWILYPATLPWSSLHLIWALSLVFSKFSILSFAESPWSHLCYLRLWPVSLMEGTALPMPGWCWMVLKTRAPFAPSRISGTCCRHFPFK